jgi:hypothetical protein
LGSDNINFDESSDDFMRIEVITSAWKDDATFPGSLVYSKSVLELADNNGQEIYEVYEFSYLTVCLGFDLLLISLKLDCIISMKSV